MRRQAQVCCTYPKSKGFVLLSLRTMHVLSRNWMVSTLTWRWNLFAIPNKYPNFIVGSFHFQVLMEVTVSDVSRGINYVSQSIVLESFFSITPQLYLDIHIDFNICLQSSTLLLCSGIMNSRPVGQYFFLYLTFNSSLFFFT